MCVCMFLIIWRFSQIYVFWVSLFRLLVLFCSLLFFSRKSNLPGMCVQLFGHTCVHIFNNFVLLVFLLCLFVYLLIFAFFAETLLGMGPGKTNFNNERLLELLHPSNAGLPYIYEDFSSWGNMVTTVLLKNKYNICILRSIIYPFVSKCHARKNWRIG